MIFSKKRYNWYMPHFDSLHPLLKIMFIIPIGIVLFSLIFNLGRQEQTSNMTQNEFAQEEKMPFQESLSATSSSHMITTQKPEKPFDFVTPQECTYAQEDFSVSAHISERRVRATLMRDESTQNVLVTNSCMYIWEQGQTTGSQMCNIEQYLSLLELFSKYTGNESWLSYLPQEYMPTHIGQNEVSDVFSSCTPAIVDEALFRMPRGIRFVEGGDTAIQ